MREYAVEIACSSWHVSSELLGALREGLVLADDGTRLRPIEAELAGPFDDREARRGAQQTWVRMRLTEGKNREIRRAWDTLGFLVTRLVRTGYGPFRLPPGLEPGAVVEASAEEMRALRAALPRAGDGRRRTDRA